MSLLARKIRLLTGKNCALSYSVNYIFTGGMVAKGLNL